MKEIKLKVWDKISKYMFIPHSIDFCNKKVMEARGKNINNEFLLREHLFKDIELMQYIGLQDCNGQDIYEGDIFISDWTNGIYYMYIVWDNELSVYRFCIYKTNEYWDEIALYNISNMQIVGNIFEGLQGDKNES